MPVLRPLLAVSLIAAFAPLTLASTTLPIQGVVRDNAGEVIAQGAFAMTFALYADLADETPIWSESWPSGAAACAPDPAPGCVVVESGAFTVLLGTTEPLASATLSAADQLYLGISVEGEPELPRRALGAAARAITAAHADVAGSIDCTGCIPASALDFDLCSVATSCGLLGPVTAGDLPPDGLDEVSNGTLTNQLERSWTADDLPVALQESAQASISVDASGALESVTVTVTLTHPGASDLRLELQAPGAAAPILLADQGSLVGPDVTGEWTHATVLGALLGTSPAGTWTVVATDLVPNGNEVNPANLLTGFSLELSYLADGVTEVSGDLVVTGEVKSPSLDALAAQVAELQAKVWCLEADCAADLGCPACHVCACDGYAQECEATEVAPDGTACETGGFAGVCSDGLCSSCGLLGAPCAPGFNCVNGFKYDYYCEATDSKSVYIPEGEFWMGCNVDNAYEADVCAAEEKQRLLVNVPAFAIDRTEVTSGEYADCLNDGPCSPPNGGSTIGSADQPINNVTRAQAESLCAWRGSNTGLAWRLCSAAEWEKAARGGCATIAGATGLGCAAGMRVYPWSAPGDIAPATCATAWMAAGTESCGFGGGTTLADSMPAGASVYGALHMAGNVNEWVADCSHTSLTGAPVNGDAWDDGCSNPGGQLRGGAYWSPAAAVRASSHGGDYPSEAHTTYGLRCCRSVDDDL